MIFGQKTTSSSCVARQMAMICGCKTNLSSCDAQLSSGKADEVISNKIGAVFKSGNQVNGKFSTESRTQPSYEASINYSLDCGNINCIIAWPGRIQNSDVAVKHFDKVQSAIQTNQKRKRDREPSRIPVRKVLKLSKRKMSRHRVQNLLRKSVPNTSCITFLCSNYKYWNLWYNNEHYFGKYVFFFKKPKKQNRVQVSQLQSNISPYVSNKIRVLSVFNNELNFKRRCTS